MLWTALFRFEYLEIGETLLCPLPPSGGRGKEGSVKLFELLYFVGKKRPLERIIIIKAQVGDLIFPHEIA